MSNPLMYQSPGANQSRALQITTWIYLLILGILNAIAATCLGVPTIWISALARTSNRLEWGFLVALLLLFLMPATFGTAYIWSAMLIRRGSDAGVLTALITTILNAIIFLAILVYDAISFAQTLALTFASITALVLHLLPLGLILAALFLLLRLRRQWRQPVSYPQTGSGQ